MAEQKIEDTKSPVARRAVRPFVGPAPSSGGAPAARPLLRPAGPAGPAGRPNPAPFAPPLASPAVTQPSEPRAALGTPSAGEDAPPTALPALRPTTLAPTFDLAVAAPTPVGPTALEPPEPSRDLMPDLSTDATPDLIDTTNFDTTNFAPESGPMPTEMAAAMDVDPVPSVEAAPRRPVTSEMVAIDAFEAFDAVWAQSPTPAASPVVDAAASPVVEPSLGAGVDGPHVWTDEIMVPPDVATFAANDQSDASDAHRGSVDSTWSGVVTPDSAVPAWLLDEPSVVPAASVPQQTEAIAPIEARSEPESAWAPLAPIAETDDVTQSALASRMHDAQPIVPDVPVVAEAVSARTARGLRVAAALDRLADRVRSGEIDVSSVAPEAPDAAVLASVLAALLGGSSSR